MARRRGDQRIQQSRRLDLVTTSQRLDHALNMASALAGVLDEIEILVGTDLLDANEHGAASWSPIQDTTQHSTTSR